MIPNDVVLKIQDFLQTDIDIYTFIPNPKGDSEDDMKKHMFKRGILLNYHIKTPFIFFVLGVGEDKIREYGFPIPFGHKFTNDKIIFDYTFEKIAFGDNELLDYLKRLPYDSDSKLYNNLLYIESHYHTTDDD